MVTIQGWYEIGRISARCVLVFVLLISKFAAAAQAIGDASTRFTYNQEYQDPITQTVYLRARNYSPQLGRFLTRDSYFVWNRYDFTDADPINYVDPSGHLSKLAIAGIAVGGAFTFFGLGFYAGRWWGLRSAERAAQEAAMIAQQQQQAAQEAVQGAVDQVVEPEPVEDPEDEQGAVDSEKDNSDSESTSYSEDLKKSKVVHYGFGKVYRDSSDDEGSTSGNSIKMEEPQDPVKGKVFEMFHDIQETGAVDALKRGGKHVRKLSVDAAKDTVRLFQRLGWVPEKSNMKPLSEFEEFKEFKEDG